MNGDKFISEKNFYIDEEPYLSCWKRIMPVDTDKGYLEAPLLTIPDR